MLLVGFPIDPVPSAIVLNVPSRGFSVLTDHEHWAEKWIGCSTTLWTGRNVGFVAKLRNLYSFVLFFLHMFILINFVLLVGFPITFDLCNG